MSDPIAAWWRAFEAQAPRLDALFSRQDEWDLPEWMHEHLGAIHPDLMWEFGPAVRGPGHRLVITPESRRELRPLVREVLRRAPELPGWEFYEYRLPEEDFEQAVQTVLGRTSREIWGVQVQARPGEFNRVDLLFSGFGFDDEQDALETVFTATETLLGEEMLDRWVGTIDVSPEADEEGPEPASVAELPELVQRLVEEMQGRLPDRPWHEVDLEASEWSMFEIERGEADEYPEQSDLIVGITPLPEMWGNALSGVPFDSARYSRFGERFCYLKIDGTQGLDGSAFEDRGDIEDALNEQLRPVGLGSVVGGGTGLRYSYIELALTDIDLAWASMQAVLREGRLPNRTWLLFHDDELRALWRGLYDDTPSPPMENKRPG